MIIKEKRQNTEESKESPRIPLAWKNPHEVETNLAQLKHLEEES